MKKTIFALCAVLLPLCANAQIDDLFADPAPTRTVKLNQKNTGSVPMQDGMVVFQKVFNVPGKTTKELYANIGYWAEKRYEAGASRAEWKSANYFKNLEFAAVKKADRATGIIECQGAEELVFKSAAWSKDWCECYYKLAFKIEEGKVTAKISNISYIYTASDIRERFMAEDWITDKEAFNKKGNPRKQQMKFRLKTIAMIDQIWKEMAIVMK